MLWEVFMTATQVRMGALSWGEVVSDPANAPMLEVAKRRRDAWGTFCRIVFDLNRLAGLLHKEDLSSDHTTAIVPYAPPTPIKPGKLRVKLAAEPVPLLQADPSLTVKASDPAELSVFALLALTLAAVFRPVWKRMRASSIPWRCVAAVGAIACPRLVATFCMRWSASVWMTFRKELGLETYTAANATRDVLVSASSMATSVVSLAIGEDIPEESGAGVILIGVLCFIVGRCR